MVPVFTFLWQELGHKAILNWSGGWERCRGRWAAPIKKGRTDFRKQLCSSCHGSQMLFAGDINGKQVCKIINFIS